LYAVSSQLKRATVFIPSNIAEDFEKNTEKSFWHFLNISRGSLFEVETQLIIAKELGFITHQKLLEAIFNPIVEEPKMTNSFSKSLKKD
jgi:four helix bundle protein